MMQTQTAREAQVNRAILVSCRVYAARQRQARLLYPVCTAGRACELPVAAPAHSRSCVPSRLLRCALLCTEHPLCAGPFGPGQPGGGAAGGCVRCPAAAGADPGGACCCRLMGVLCLLGAPAAGLRVQQHIARRQAQALPEEPLLQPAQTSAAVRSLPSAWSYPARPRSVQSVRRRPAPGRHCPGRPRCPARGRSRGRRRPAGRACTAP